MVTITTKKILDFAELVQWAFDNPNKVIGKSIFPDNRISGEIYFAANGGVVFHDKFHAKDDTFTVEVEEEITEKTVVPQLLEIRRGSEGDIFPCTIWNDDIACAKDPYSLSFYKVNEDGTLTLLWTKEGGMQ